MKRIFTFLLLGIFMISLSSAWDFDNVKTYNEETKTFTVNNCDIWAIVCLNIGEELGNGKLNTPQLYEVGVGEDIKVAEFFITNKKEYKNLIKSIEENMKFYDSNNNMKETTKEIELKFKTTSIQLQNVYEEDCDNKFFIGDVEVCSSKIIGEKEVEVEIWKTIDKLDLATNENITIGIFTTTVEGERIEWVSKFYGKRVTEWSEWVAGTDTGLVSYYGLNSTTGLDSLGNNDAVSVVATTGQVGVVSNSFFFDGTNDYVDLASFSGAIYGDTEFSVSFWFNATTLQTSTAFFSDFDGTDLSIDIRNDLMFYDAGGGFQSFDWELGTLNLNTWYNLVLTYESGDGFRVYINGSLVDNNSETGTIAAQKSGNGLKIANDDYDGATTDFHGYMDEVGVWNRTLTPTEITGIYDAGLTGVGYNPGGASPSNGTIAITYPTTLDLFQRNSTGHADIFIQGTIADNTTASVEARFNGGSWVEIDSSPSASGFSGTLTALEGQGTLEVRFSDNIVVTDSISTVGVGDWFVIAGQSNAKQAGDNFNSLNVSDTINAVVFMYNDTLKIANDPLSANGGSYGSTYPGIADYIQNNQSVPLGFISTAVGGTALNTWQPGQTNYDTMLAQVDKATNNSRKVKSILFFQGESDALLSEPGCDGDYDCYYGQLNGFVNNATLDLNLENNILIGSIGEITAATRASMDGIRRAQRDVWINNNNADAGAITYDINLADGLHFRTDSEIAQFESRWIASIITNIYGYGSGDPMKVSTALAESNNLTLFFSGGSGVLPPILQGSNYEGFRIENNTVLLDETNVLSSTIIDNSLRLELDTIIGDSFNFTFASYNDAVSKDTINSSNIIPIPPVMEYGVNISSTEPISIQLNSPDDSSTSVIPLVNFNCSAYRFDGVTQLDFILDGVINETVTNSTQAQNLSISKNINLSEDSYVWSCNASNIDIFTQSENRSLTVSYSTPEITLISPANGSSSLDSETTFTFNAIDSNGIKNVSLLVDNIVVNFSTTGVNGSYEFVNTILGGVHNWTVQSYSILDKLGTTNYFYFTVHIAGPTVNITAPSGIINYFQLGDNETLIYDISEAGQNSSHFDSCWYVYGPESYCYQESADTTNQTGIDGDCGLNYSGNYDVNLSENNFYINYTKPENITGARWLVKHSFDRDEYNISIPQSCLEENTIMLRFETENYYSNPQCFNGILWESLSTIESFPSGGSFSSGGSINTINDGNWSSAVSIRSNGLITNYDGGYLYKQVFEEAMYWEFGTLLNCSANQENFTYINGQNDITVFAEDEFGFLTNSSSSWEYLLLEINQTYEENITETLFNDFRIDISTSASSITSPKLIYNGIENTAVLNSIGDNYYLTSSVITNNSLIGNNSFYWNITLDGTELSSSINYQNVSEINFSICGGNNNITYISFDFQDELTLLNVNGTIRTSTFDYYIEDILAVKTYTFSTAGNESQYDFCFEPQYNITVDYSISYYGDGYPERTFGTESELTDETTNVTLNLLGDGSGLYATFKFIDSTTKVGLTEVSVLIYEGTNLIIEKVTDSSGVISEWLNPNILYEVQYTKTGYEGGSQSHRPVSTETINIEMISDIAIAGSFIANGLVTLFYPQITTLEANTTYNFGFYAKEGEEEIDTMKFSVYDEDGNLIYQAEKSNDGNMTQQPIFTGDNRTFMVVYELEGEEGGYWKFNRMYYITIISSTDYSLNSWGKSLNSYFPSADRTVLTNLVWYILWFVSMITGFSFGYNGSYRSQEDNRNNITAETRSNTTTGLFFAYIITWIFCYFNLVPFNFPYPETYWGVDGVEWLRQYFLAVIMVLPLVPAIKGAIDKWNRRGN